MATSQLEVSDEDCQNRVSSLSMWAISTLIFLMSTQQLKDNHSAMYSGTKIILDHSRRPKVINLGDLLSEPNINYFPKWSHRSFDILGILNNNLIIFPLKKFYSIYSWIYIKTEPIIYVLWQFYLPFLMCMIKNYIVPRGKPECGGKNRKGSCFLLWI